jgi:taurine transport system permease protein
MLDFDTEALTLPAVDIPDESPALTFRTTTLSPSLQPLPWQRWLAQPRLLSLATVIMLLAFWWLVTALQLVPPLFLPSPSAVLSKLYQVATEGYMDATLWQHLGASLARIAVALLAASLTAIPLGIALGRSARAIADPIIEFYRPAGDAPGHYSR